MKNYTGWALGVGIFAAISLILGVASIPIQVQAQGSTVCTQTVAITAAASASATLLTAVPGQTPYVCAYDFSGDTIATSATWKSGSTSLSGAELSGANGHFTAGTGTGILLEGTLGNNLTIAASAGAIAGWARVGQH